MSKFIVAEASKSWINADHAAFDDETLLCERFEKIINVNEDRGYVLDSWQLSRVSIVKDEAVHTNETIIAVFKEQESDRLKWEQDKQE